MHIKFLQSHTHDDVRHKEGSVIEMAESWALNWILSNGIAQAIEMVETITEEEPKPKRSKPLLTTEQEVIGDG